MHLLQGDKTAAVGVVSRNSRQELLPVCGHRVGKVVRRIAEIQIARGGALPLQAAHSPNSGAEAVEQPSLVCPGSHTDHSGDPCGWSLFFRRGTEGGIENGRGNGIGTQGWVILGLSIKQIRAVGPTFQRVRSRGIREDF
jgi:hypothetical protein